MLRGWLWGHDEVVVDVGEASVGEVVVAVTPGISPESQSQGSINSKWCAENISSSERSLSLTPVLVEVVDPLVGRLPDDGPDPQGQVGGHQVHEPEPGKEPKAFNDDL